MLFGTKTRRVRQTCELHRDQGIWPNVMTNQHCWLQEKNKKLQLAQGYWLSTLPMACQVRAVLGLNQQSVSTGKCHEALPRDHSQWQGAVEAGVIGQQFSSQVGLEPSS